MELSCIPVPLHHVVRYVKEAVFNYKNLIYPNKCIIKKCETDTFHIGVG